MKTVVNPNVRILIVEDDPVYRTIVQALLEHYFTVKNVSNGREALKALEEAPYDIILMDINLGEGEPDGTETMKKIRQDVRYAGIKIFAVTAYYHKREWFLNQGFDELYTKPVVKEEIIEAIRKMHIREDKMNIPGTAA